MENERGSDMPITTVRIGDRTTKRGSETFPNGMTLTYHGPDEHVPSCARLFDMAHARTWLAADGEPTCRSEKGDADMGGRGKSYSTGNTRQTYVTGRRGERRATSLTAGQSEVVRSASDGSRRRNSLNRTLNIGR